MNPSILALPLLVKKGLLWIRPAALAVVLAACAAKYCARCALD